MIRKIFAVLCLCLFFIILTGVGVVSSEEPTEEVIYLTAEEIANRPLIKAAAKEPVIEIQEPLDEEEVYTLSCLGTFKLTAYCSCSKCCGKWASVRPGDKVVGSIGEELTPGYSIAVDPEVIPYNTVVVIDGKEYRAMDCGEAIKDKRIDIYFNEHTEALNFGVKYAEVYRKFFN